MRYTDDPAGELYHTLKKKGIIPKLENQPCVAELKELYVFILSKRRLKKGLMYPEQEGQVYQSSRAEHLPAAPTVYHPILFGKIPQSFSNIPMEAETNINF